MPTKLTFGQLIFCLILLDKRRTNPHFVKFHNPQPYTHALLWEYMDNDGKFAIYFPFNSSATTNDEMEKLEVDSNSPIQGVDANGQPLTGEGRDDVTFYLNTLATILNPADPSMHLKSVPLEILGQSPSAALGSMFRLIHLSNQPAFTDGTYLLVGTKIVIPRCLTKACIASLTDRDNTFLTTPNQSLQVLQAAIQGKDAHTILEQRAGLLPDII